MNIAESESGAAAAANQKASNAARGKDGPVIVKMEGVQLFGIIPLTLIPIRKKRRKTAICVTVLGNLSTIEIN